MRPTGSRFRGAKKRGETSLAHGAERGRRREGEDDEVAEWGWKTREGEHDDGDRSFAARGRSFTFSDVTAQWRRLRASEPAADWPREMMAGAFANRLPDVPSSPVCRYDPPLHSSTKVGVEEEGARNPGGRGLPLAGSELRPEGVQMLRQFRSLVESGSCICFLRFRWTYSKRDRRTYRERIIRRQARRLARIIGKRAAKAYIYVKTRVRN